MGRVMAIDYGKKRTGLATTDPLRIIASPLATIETRELMEYLEKYFAQNDVDILVVGLPTQPSGEPSESQRYVLPFIGRLKARFPNLDLRTYDERYTSVLAHRAMIEAGVPMMKRRDKAIVDRTAAAIILHDFMEHLSSQNR